MIKVGLIGCGFIAKKHVHTLATFSDMDLIAVSDINWDQMKDVASLYDKNKGGNTSITLYNNYEHMLLDGRIDMVIITTPSSLHVEIAKKAIKHGKHIIVEKPLSLSLKEAEEIIHLSEVYDKKTLVCHQLRYRPMLAKVKELLNKGYFGELYLGVISLRLHRSEDYYISSDWKGTWSKDGGMLLNQGIHFMDLFTWMFGEVSSVYGEITNKRNYKETEDIACGILSFKNGAKGIIEANTISKPENIGYSLSIFGEKGSLCIGGKSFNEIEHCYIEGALNVKEELLQLGKITNERERMYQDFINAVYNKHDHMLDVKEGKKALETTFALYQSAKEKKPVFLMTDGKANTLKGSDMHD